MLCVLTMICNRLQFFLVCSKTIFSVSIIILIVTPTKIHRNELAHKPEEYNFTYIHHHVRHLVCAMPNGDDIDSISPKELLEALELPSGTVTGRRLKNFGRCRAERMKSGKDISDCMCYERPAFFLLLVVAFCSMLIDFLRFCLPTAFKRFQNDKYSTMSNFFVISCSCSSWFLVGIAAAISHSNWDDEVWLVNKLYSENYFCRPPSWSLAVALAFFCSGCSVLELLHLRKRTVASMKDQQKTAEEQHKDLEICSDDGKNIDISSGVKENVLKVRKFQKRMIRSWP